VPARLDRRAARRGVRPQQHAGDVHRRERHLRARCDPSDVHPAPDLAPGGPMRSLAILVLAAGCGAGGYANTDANPSDGGRCHSSIMITSTPDTPPIAKPSTVIRATAVGQNVIGVPTLSWDVSFMGGPVTFTPTGDAIEFGAPTAGTYTVTL